jgi:hypothetical protein
MMMAVFWDVALCSPVEIGRHFKGAYCLHHQGDDGGSNPEDGHLVINNMVILKSRSDNKHRELFKTWRQQQFKKTAAHTNEITK